MSTDGNQQLYDSRRALVASGEWSRRDDGSYVAADPAEVVGRDGLDTSRGQAALYTSTPAWHGLGQVIPGGTTDIDHVLQLGGIDFDVELRKARYLIHGADGRPDYRIVPGQYVTVRTDTGAALGIVGRRYLPIQNRGLFAFLEDLVNTREVIWESAGALREGQRVFVSLRLPESVRVDAEGINDEIVPFVVMLNSHDGRSPAQALITPWRPVCANTERFAVRDAYTRWSVRHTAGALDRLGEARRTLGLTTAYYRQWAAEETALARTDILIDDMRALIDELWPIEQDASSRIRARADRRRETLMALYDNETDRLGRTAYAAERTVTGYLDHIAAIRPSGVLAANALAARGARLLDGTDDVIKSTAHKQLMLLTRR
ncbi:DUF932 domain-containing protein [Planobispora takensis]|uniref:DUF932 domain-containing protein n=1 Tax=Planobispora takensis TaxID=1367882 RepID=A0A8J3T5X0_9ACTN|nr:DUF932 domain-containing protein [Planobispora takensis]GII05480.1 hypothetical protein Pta02_74880 [Planobispora takensis]